MITPDLKLLCVDDEAHVLESLRRTLRRRFLVTTALGAEQGLASLESEGPFAVVMSDLRMPEMDGISFLRAVRSHDSDTVRVLLTGQADLHSAMAAVNEGAVFRFLTKPCPPPELLQALDAAAEQYRLVTAERQILEQTLHGSVKAMTDILAMINPAGFGRATRAKQKVTEFLEARGVARDWELEVASMLSQIGSVTLPGEIVERLYRGERLTYAESLAAEKLPIAASELISGIPRLESVGEMLRSQGRRFDGIGSPPDAPVGDQIPWGARLLKIILDFDVLESRGLGGEEAVDMLRSRTGWYDPDLIEEFAKVHSATFGHQATVEIELRAVRSGMVFAEDVTTTSGTLLLARGQEVSERLLERIRNMGKHAAVQQHVQVFVAPSPSIRSASQGLRPVALP